MDTTSAVLTDIKENNTIAGSISSFFLSDWGPIGVGPLFSAVNV
jgi:hypothetical protein